MKLSSLTHHSSSPKKTLYIPLLSKVRKRSFDELRTPVKPPHQHCCPSSPTLRWDFDAPHHDTTDENVGVPELQKMRRTHESRAASCRQQNNPIFLN
ncbi:unnamed protein product [Cochlearia groenlandica]